VNRESRERRAEAYQAGKDAHTHVMMAVGWLKRRWRTPEYLLPDRDPDAKRRGLRDLMRDHQIRPSSGRSADAMRAAFLREVQPDDEEATH